MLTLKCPVCGQAGRIDVSITDDEPNFTCQECSDEFDVECVKEYIESVEKWRRVLEWMQLKPQDDVADMFDASGTAKKWGQPA